VSEFWGKDNNTEAEVEMYGTSDNKCAQLNPGSCFFTEFIVIESFTQLNHAVDAQHKEVGIMLTT
jgi:hypothetical protein